MPKPLLLFLLLFVEERVQNFTRPPFLEYATREAFCGANNDTLGREAIGIFLFAGKLHQLFNVEPKGTAIVNNVSDPHEVVFCAELHQFVIIGVETGFDVKKVEDMQL